MGNPHQQQANWKKKNCPEPTSKALDGDREWLQEETIPGVPPTSRARARTGHTPGNISTVQPLDNL